MQQTGLVAFLFIIIIIASFAIHLHARDSAHYIEKSEAYYACCTPHLARYDLAIPTYLTTRQAL